MRYISRDFLNPTQDADFVEQTETGTATVTPGQNTIQLDDTDFYTCLQSVSYNTVMTDGGVAMTDGGGDFTTEILTFPTDYPWTLSPIYNEGSGFFSEDANGNLIINNDVSWISPGISAGDSDFTVEVDVSADPAFSGDNAKLNLIYFDESGNTVFDTVNIDFSDNQSTYSLTITAAEMSGINFTNLGARIDNGSGSNQLKVEELRFIRLIDNSPPDSLVVDDVVVDINGSELEVFNGYDSDFDINYTVRYLGLVT